MIFFKKKTSNKNNTFHETKYDIARQKLSETMNSTIDLSKEVSKIIKYNELKCIETFNFDFLNDSLIIINESGKIINLNFAATELFEWDKAELINKDFTILFSSSKELTYATFIDSLDAEHGFDNNNTIEGNQIDIKGISKSKKIFDIDISPSIAQKTMASYIILRIHDISKYDLFINSIQKNRNHYQSLFEKNKDGIAILKNSRVLEANESFKKLFGENIIGESFKKNIHINYKNDFSLYHKQHMYGNQKDHEIILVCKTKEKEYTYFIATMIFIDNNIVGKSTMLTLKQLSNEMLSHIEQSIGTTIMMD